MRSSRPLADRPQRGDQDVVGHDGAGAEHLRATDRDAAGILVADGGRQERILCSPAAFDRSACGSMMT